MHLPIDAVPDLTNVQVQVITEAPALSPLEVETLLSFPVEGAMSGLPNVEQIRSISKFGISVVTIVFHEGTDIYRARQLVGERLGRAAAAIPPGYGTPTLGPITTALGEVFQFQVKATKESGVTPMELRTILDWFVAYQLRGVPGVTEINSHGGELKTYQVELDPDKLGTYQLSMTDVFNALRSNNANVGGGYLVHEGEARYIRGESQAHNVADIAAIVIDERNGVPVTIADVAKVHPAPMIRAGLVTRDGQGEIVTGLVMMLIGENSRRVVERGQGRRSTELQKSLPPGVTIEPLYDRTHLIDHTLDTVLHNLAAGGVLVIAVLLVLLGNLRGGLIVALAIPLSMLFAANIMLATGVTASLMSLGAIDFGMIVDSSVIMIENCVRRLAHEGGTRPKLEIIRDAAVEVRKPTMFGELIIAIVYLPILALQGTEGKLFRPMALTVIFALAGSMVLSLTLMPVLASLGLSSKAEEKEVWLIRAAKRVLHADARRDDPPARRWPRFWRSVWSPSACPVALHLGGEFMPRLNEGDLLIEAVRIPSAALEGAVAASTQIENILKTVPRGPDGLLQDRPARDRQRRDGGAPDRRLDDAQAAGRVAAGADPRRPDRGDGQGADRERARREVRLQPADRDAGQRAGGRGQERRGRLALRPRPRRAPPEGDRDRAGAGADPGAQDIKTPTSGRLPMLRISVRRDQLARYGIKAADVLDADRRAGGHDRRHGLRGGRSAAPIQVRLPPSWRNDPEKIKSIRITDPQGRPIALQRPGRRLVRGRAQRGRARERPAPRGGRGQRPGPRHRRLRRRGAGRDRRQGQAAPRLHPPLGRPVRAPADRHRSGS